MYACLCWLVHGNAGVCRGKRCWIPPLIRTRVTGGCEPSDVGAGPQLRSSGGAVHALKLLSHPSSLRIHGFETSTEINFSSSLQNCAVIPSVYFQNILFASEGNPVPVHCPLSPHPLSTARPLSVLPSASSANFIGGQLLSFSIMLSSSIHVLWGVHILNLCRYCKLLGTAVGSAYGSHPLPLISPPK